MTDFSLDDIRTIEEDEDASPFELSAAIQRAINGGMWSLQGSYGRSMMHAIEAGQCLLGRSFARDYWGNHIPSRDQVQDGTKGSRAYVAERMGEEWAKRMEAI